MCPRSRPHLHLLLLLGANGVCVAAPASASTSSASRRAEAPPARVVVIGVDAASWNVLAPLMAKGALPNMARLAKRGLAGNLPSYWPLRTPQVWTSVVTGKLTLCHFSVATS